MAITSRITDADVRAIIQLPSRMTDLEAFRITAASLVQTSGVEDCDALGEDNLKEIERWLAAHFAAIDGQRVTKEKLGDADVTYQHKEDLRLHLTHYGQMAMTLDVCGYLRRLDEKGSTLAPLIEVIPEESST